MVKIMKDYPYKTLSITDKDLEFTKQSFITTRYSMTSIIKCENLYSFSKENELSFFNLCVAAIYKTIESIPELRQCVMNGEGREYEHINIIMPLIKDDHSVQNISIDSIHDYNSFKEWNDCLNNVKNNIEDYRYDYGPDSLNHVFAILSCMPWIHYCEFKDMTLDSDKFFPAIYWGKYEEGILPVTITVNHIFVYGYHLGLFYNRLSEYMENPESIFTYMK